MIDHIKKGRFVAGLLYYLYGPGKSDEHRNPHLVAAWRDQLTNLEPPIRPDGRRDFRHLTNLLNAPLTAAGRCGQNGTVWHCVLSAAPADPLLTDDEWNAIATDFMDLMGLARKDDPAGVRWVAVRHGLSRGGIDHIHIAATLARQDGQLPSLHNDFLRARRACLEIEQRHGLTVTAPADRTARARPTRAETERAARNEQTEPPRIMLCRCVQAAAAVAHSEADFFTRIRGSGVLIRERRSETEPGRITGYAVALAGDVSRTGAPIWYSGGKLAPDLTLPRLRRRWERSANPERGAQNGLSPRSVRAALRSAATAAAAHAGSDVDFFDRLTSAGVLIRYRYSDQNPGQITGYAISLPGHQDAHGEPLWYSGGRLSADLTLPRLRRRWNGTGSQPVRAAVDPSERRALWDDIIRMTGSTAAQLRSGIDQRTAAELAQATADALSSSALAVHGPARRDLQQAADAFDRAAREAYGATPRPTAHGDALRTTSRLLAVLGSAGSGPAALTMLITNLAELVAAVADLRQVQGRAHQEAAARAAAGQLHRLAQHTAIQRSPASTRLARILQPPAVPARPVPPQRRYTGTKPHTPNRSP
ncbi:MAG TPA: hypothetical protein VN969_28650 [Streptosporangiaceae bacterium]|nr:hypothetical protein [Streptosporangiaceae bacterium]